MEEHNTVKGQENIIHFYIIIKRPYHDNQRILVLSVACIVATVLWVSLIIASSSPIEINSPSVLQVFAQDQEVPFNVQNTSKSIQDPLPGHEMHQVVFAAPPRSDGKIYSGLLTFAASVPIEVIGFNPFKLMTTTMKADLLPFEGAALTFHQSDGKPFTVEYTINGTIKPPQPQ